MDRLIDITPALSPETAVWPGDVALERVTALRIADGANIDLSSIRTTLHIGAHADAPSHYARSGESIEKRSLDLYYGPCQVIPVDIGSGQRIRPHDVGVAITEPRVIFHTRTFPDPNRWNDDFAALSAELVHYLADQGVRLVGIDTPSIDLCHDKVLEAHTAVFARGLAILEGLVLAGVAPGRYTLIALPLPLVGADASPVRAVLAPPG